MQMLSLIERWAEDPEGFVVVEKVTNGGKGSGNFGHSGREGKVGGSAPSGNSGSLLESEAKKLTWAEYQNKVRDKDFIEACKSAGINTFEKLWQKWAKIKLQDFTEKDIKELSKEETEKTVKKYLDDLNPDMWFVNADSSYKPGIVNRILENKELRNAGLNLAYQNYKYSDDKVNFKEFLNTDRILYRGHRGQKKIDSDWFDSYTPHRHFAEIHGDQIDEIKVRPRDTLGSYTTNPENEILVLTKIKETNSFFANGGKGSGNFGHAGRKGKVGGSAPNDYVDYSITQISPLWIEQGIYNGPEPRYFMEENPDVSFEKNVTTEEQKQAIFEYTTNGGTVFNSYLRDGLLGSETSQVIEDRIKALDSCLDGKLSENTIGYRAVKFTKDFKPFNEGDIIDNAGYTSVSLYPEAMSEALGQNKIRLKIPKGTNALYIGGDTSAQVLFEGEASHNDEDELLLRRGLKMKITKSYRGLDEMTKYDMDIPDGVMYEAEIIK